MCLGGSDDAASLARQQQQQQQQIMQQGTGAIDRAFAQFTPGFYQQRQQDYINYAAPQYAQQYQQTRNAMLAGLSNRGLLKGSAAQEQANKLALASGQAQQQIGQSAVDQARQLQEKVEQSRSSLVGQLASTMDPATTTQSAISSAANIQAPSSFAPLGPMFQNFANTYLANQYAQAYAPLNAYYSQYYGGGGPGGGLGAGGGFMPSPASYSK